MKIKTRDEFTDFEQLASQCYQLCQTSFLTASPWSVAQFLTDFQGNVTRYYFVVNETDELMGFVNGQLLYDEFEIFLLVVKDSMKRQGIATLLLDYLMVAPDLRQLSTFLLEVRESNSDAQNFYKQQGFTLYHRRKHYYQQPVEDALLLRKEVGIEANE